MRTNIDIDDELMRQAMAATSAPTKKAVVEEALKLFVQIKGQGAIRDLWGTVTWCGPDDDWFAPDPLDPEWNATLESRKAIAEKIQAAYKALPIEADAPHGHR